MELVPTEEGELGSVATVTFATQASAKARCTRPELALRLSSKAQVHAGQQHVVQVEVSNPGTGDATERDAVRDRSFRRQPRSRADRGI